MAAPDRKKPPKCEVSRKCRRKYPEEYEECKKKYKLKKRVCTRAGILGRKRRKNSKRYR